MDDQTHSIQGLIFNILQPLTISIISQHVSLRFYNLQVHNGYHFHLLTCRRIPHEHIFLTLIFFFFHKLPTADKVICREIFHVKRCSKAERQLNQFGSYLTRTFSLFGALDFRKHFHPRCLHSILLQSCKSGSTNTIASKYWF